MFTRKKLLVAFTLLLIGGAIGCYVWVTNGSTTETEIIDTWEPKLPTSASLMLPNEDSGELWRKPVKSASGKLTELHIGYKDGRLGVYQFDQNEKVQTFTCFSAEDTTRAIYRSWFGTDSMRQKAQTLRADGTVESEYRRQPDGTEVRDHMDSTGQRVDRSVTTLPDGSQRSASRGTDGKVTVQVTEAKAQTFTHGERLSADGTKVPAFKINTVGVRVKDWEFYDTNGKLRHKGQFNDDGSMEMTLINDEGKSLLKQYWKRCGDDWNRSFYRVEKLEIFDESGNVSIRATLNKDGMTPNEVQHMSGGSVQRTEFYDEKGFGTKVEYNYGAYYGGGYPYGGGGTNVQEIPPQQRRQLVLPPHIIGEMGGMDPNMRVYRLRGTPFADPTPSSAPALPSMFIAP